MSLRDIHFHLNEIVFLNTQRRGLIVMKNTTLLLKEIMGYRIEHLTFAKNARVYDQNE